jgi:hypothetical protein
MCKILPLTHYKPFIKTTPNERDTDVLLGSSQKPYTMTGVLKRVTSQTESYVIQNPIFLSVITNVTECKLLI